MRLLPSLRLNHRTCWRRNPATPNPARTMKSNISAHWPKDGTGVAWPVLVDTITQVMAAVTPLVVMAFGCVTNGLPCHL